MFAQNGFAILPQVFDTHEVGAMQAAVAELAPDPSSPGTRTLLRHPFFAGLAASSKVQTLVDQALGSPGRAVRGIYFDKSPSANWTLGWHRDLKIPVAERHEVEGFHAWSVKEGVTHVQPPLDILRQMVAVRIHLDDSALDNGPLECVPGSHLDGFSTEAEFWDNLSVPCPCPRGGVILMSPLTLHRSRHSTSPHPRRVLHFEIAATRLPAPLMWAAWS
jgi:ectoine hydroxylase-related dioxygenase (phytanoyl-CoA dioxygenase family)